MRFFCRNISGTCVLCLFVLLLLCQWTSAAPAERHYLTTNRLRAETENPLSYLASRALGVFVRTVSLFYQWVPDFFRRPAPPRPRRLSKNSERRKSRRRHYDDDDDDFD